jgi:hypothetical protein
MSLILLFAVQSEVAWGQPATDLECAPAGCVDTSDLGNFSVVPWKIANGAVRSNKIADGAVTANKLSPDVEVLETLSCNENQVPVFTGGVWVCGDVARSSNMSGFGLPFAADENNRNVIVTSRVNPDGSVDYLLRIRFQATTFQISVNGTPTNVPFVAMYPNVFTDSGGNPTFVYNYIEAPATLDYVDYLVEESEYDPGTLAKTVTKDTERWVDTCGSEVGGAVLMCISRVTASLDDSFQYFWFYRRGAQVVLGPYEVNGLSFSNVLMETRRGDNYRLRAEGIGTILRGQAGSTLNVIYYRVDGQTDGSLAGTPFAAGAALEGLFFTP